MLRGIRLGRREARGGAGGADRSRAFDAEFGSRGKLCPTVRAADGKGSRALQTEFRLGRVLLLAPGALHASLHVTSRARREGRPDRIGRVDITRCWARPTGRLQPRATDGPNTGRLYSPSRSDPSAHRTSTVMP